MVFIQDGLVSAILFYAQEQALERPDYLFPSRKVDALHEQLGHRDINTTRIYLRLSVEDVKRAVAKIHF